MCVLMIGWKMRQWPSLVVAANRDEARHRPSLPPRVLQVGERRVLLPLDEVAGGTWLGVNDAGLAVALTNRADAQFDPQRTSRGQLARHSLGCDSAAAARAALAASVEEQQFNGFNLFCADASHAWVATWNDGLRFDELAPGTHVLTNSHDLDVLALPELQELEWEAAPWPHLRHQLQVLLGDHTRRNGDATILCKHGETHGTVSSALFYPCRSGGWHMDFAAGNPCTKSFVPYLLEVDTTPGGSSAAPQV